MKLNRSLRGMMCAESSDRFIGHRLGRLSQSAIGGEAHWQFLVLSHEKDAGAGTRSDDPMSLDVHGDAEVSKGRSHAVHHALRDVSGQVCGDRAAGDPLQGLSLI